MAKIKISIYLGDLSLDLSDHCPLALAIWLCDYIVLYFDLFAIYNLSCKLSCILLQIIQYHTQFKY